mmetsp:Transcript_36979/g.73193  ORF Transcript_36979/g.73193 Transcript_36979/m.73193 type:complete len:146 (-) Transcript_36979:42-479(-)
MQNRSRSPHRTAHAPTMVTPLAVAPAQWPAAPVGGVPAPTVRPFTGVRTTMPMAMSATFSGTTFPIQMEQRPMAMRGPADPLDAYMASVHRELDRLNKGKKKSSQKVGDVASAREAFGPQALQKLRPGGFEARDTDSLQEDKLLR